MVMGSMGSISIPYASSPDYIFHYQLNLSQLYKTLFKNDYSHEHTQSFIYRNNMQMNSSNTFHEVPKRKHRNTPFLFFLMGMVVCLFLFFSPAQKLLIVPAIVLVLAAIVYFIYLVYINVRNSRTGKDVINGIPDNKRIAYENHPAVRFATSTQRYTRIFNVIFIITIIALLCTLFISSQVSEVKVNFLEPSVPLLFAALLTWLFSIIAGQPLIRDQDIRFAEQYAIQTKTGQWRKITHNRIITWSVWGIGTAIIPLLTISALVM